MPMRTYCCPECAHEWKDGDEVEEVAAIQDAFGTLLVDGDVVTVIKDLKIKRFFISGQSRHQS